MQPKPNKHSTVSVSKSRHPATGEKFYRAALIIPTEKFMHLRRLRRTFESATKALIYGYAVEVRYDRIFGKPASQQ